MRTTGTRHTVLLTGEVVETFERDGQQIAKLSLRSFHMEVPIDLVHAAHLGDRVHLAVTISIDKLDSNIRIDNSDQYS
jgi:hypothetical protein